MPRTSRSRSPPPRNTTLVIRTRDAFARPDIITPAAGKFISTQADQCPFPGCTNRFLHQHSTSEGKTAPSVEEYRNAGAAIRAQWTEEQRRRITENEAVLRQLAGVEPKVGSLSIQPHLPRGNDLTVPEQIAIIHGQATPAQDAATHEILSKRERQDFSSCPGVPQIKDTPQPQAEQTISLDYDDFPELSAKYGDPAEVFENVNPAIATEVPRHRHVGTGLPVDGTTKPFSRYQNTYFLNTNPLCTGPCPVQIPHNQGAYLQQGQVPRVWNARWGYSDPPRAIWEAWVRVENGTASSWDQVEVDGFALSHGWAGP